MLGSTGWFGAAKIVHPKNAPNTPAKFCAHGDSNLSVGTANERAISWSGGWNLGGTLGVKGVSLKVSYSSSAHTGYDSNDQMVFTFGHAGFLCGTNHDWQAEQVVMRGTKILIADRMLPVGRAAVYRSWHATAR